MTFRGYLKWLDEQGRLVKVSRPVRKEHELAGVLKRLEPQPVLFEQVREAEFPRGGQPVLQQGSLR